MRARRRYGGSRSRRPDITRRSFSAAEILATLYYSVMKLEKGDPTWSGRDRFLFGKGHAAVGLYPVLADWGFFDAAILDRVRPAGEPAR